MKDEGWSWGDLAGELMARGIDPDEVSSGEVVRVLHHRQVERAVDDIAQDRR